MRKIAAFILLVTALALTHASFFSVFGRPLSLVNLPLILVVSVAVGLRVAPAVGAAFIAGTVMDSLSAVPYGTYTLAMVAVSFAAVVLFSTVLTHLSFFSYLGTNAGAYLLFYLIAFLVSTVGRVIAGYPVLMPGIRGAFVAVIVALPIQLAICVVFRFLMARIPRRSPNFMILR